MNRSVQNRLVGVKRATGHCNATQGLALAGDGHGLVVAGAGVLDVDEQDVGILAEVDAAAFGRLGACRGALLQFQRVCGTRL
jgi:sigma54-dependent transcription regulator